MADDQVHQTLSRLWDLLRKPELSTEVAAALGRSVRQVDGFRVALDEAEQHQHLNQGLVELRAALGLIEASSHPFDRDQLGAVQAAALLLATRANPESTASDAAGDRRAGRGPRASRAQGAAARDEQSAGRQVELLGDLYRHRVHLLEDPRVRWDTLARVEARIERAVRALRWISGQALQFVDERRLESDDLAWGFELVAASLQIGDGARIDEALACAEGDGIGDIDARALTLAALSVPGRRETHDQVKALFARTQDAALRASLLPWLFDRQLVPPADLVGFLSGDDQLAASAADVLVWVAGRDYGPLLFQRGCSAGAGIKGNAFLSTASLLGSATALQESRGRVDAGEGDRRLVDALAVVGDARDVPRLEAVAGKGGATGALAALAAEHVQLDRRVDTALAALMSPATFVPRRFWSALYVAMQTGHRLGAIYRPDASAQRQDQVARGWAAYLSAPGQTRP